MRLPTPPGGVYWLPILIGILGYSTLNRGFAYIGVYPVFWAEVCLFWYAFTLKHNKALPRFCSTPAGYAWLLFFLYSAAIFAISASREYSEAIRNSVLWWYTIYFYLGFVFGGAILRRGEAAQWQRFLVSCAKCVIIYFVLFPWRMELRALTPWLHGGEVSLIGYYSSLHALALGLVFLLLFQSGSRANTVFFVVGFACVIAISQARAAMLAAALMGILVLLGRSSNVRKRLWYALLATTLVGITYSLSGFTVEGQKGSVSIDTIGGAAASIFVVSDNASLDGSRTDRLEMWRDVLGRTFVDIETAVFGMGLDEILVDRATGPGFILRYPHNSFVSVIGLLGLIGFTLLLRILGLVFKAVRRAVTLGSESTLLRWYPVFALGFLVCAFFGTVLVAPFHSFVFWILTGVTYRFACEYNGTPRRSRALAADRNAGGL